MHDTADSYLLLGTSNKRAESSADHVTLRLLKDKHWDAIINRPRHSLVDIQAYQFARIQQLVAHSFETVPLYREKYSACGFEPNDLKTWNDFEQLPLLTKPELIQGFPSKTISSKHNLEFTTRSSGSSGQFVTLVVSPQAVYLDTLQGARQFIQQSGGEYRPNDLALFVYTSPWWVASIDGEYPTSFLPTTSEPQVVQEAIAKLRPKVISTYPEYLKKLRASGTSVKEHGVSLIVVHSEQSTRGQRKELSDYFGVPVLDEFSSEELTRIALECPHGAYHLEEDACYIEVIDPITGKHAQTEKTGQIIGTNLLNEATPIIRYSQGDLGAILKQKKCDCGSNFRILSEPQGRVMDSIKLEDGSFVPASCFMDLAYNWYLENDIPVHGMSYQMVQQSSKQIDIFVKPERFPLTPAQIERMRQSVYTLIPHTMQVNVQQVNEIPQISGAKKRPIVSRVMR